MMSDISDMITAESFAKQNFSATLVLKNKVISDALDLEKTVVDQNFWYLKKGGKRYVSTFVFLHHKCKL